MMIVINIGIYTISLIGLVIVVVTNIKK